MHRHMNAHTDAYKHKHICTHTHNTHNTHTQETADAAPDTLLQADPQSVINSSHSAARQLGLHYLKRYFLLIVYR